MGRNKNEGRGFYGKPIAQKRRNKNEKRNKSECNKNEWGQYIYDDHVLKRLVIFEQTILSGSERK